MRVLTRFLVVALSLGLVGCNLFGKKNSSSSSASSNARAPASIERPQPTGGSGLDLTSSRTTAATTTGEVGGLLAGQVVDAYNRRPPVTYIRVVSTAQAGGTKAAPIEVSTDQQGYFTIQGLRPGRHYELIARASDGDKMMAGRAWVTPPDAKVLIRISEDFHSENVPPIPPPPNAQKKVDPPPPQWPDKDKASGGDAAPKSNETPAKTNAIGGPNRAELGQPDKEQPPPRTESIAQDNRTAANRNLLNINPQAPRQDGEKGAETAAAATTETAGAAGVAITPNVPTRVPSCRLLGKQLQNFALNDLNGQPWEFRKRQGRMVLLDFWGTWCPHCLQSIPELNRLQDQYARQGLEVIGIAYERGATPQERLSKVQRTCGLRRINYLVLMGSCDIDHERNCPVLTQFAIESYPTLILLDESGKIVWRCNQALDREKLETLERHLQRHLVTR